PSPSRSRMFPTSTISNAELGRARVRWERASAALQPSRRGEGAELRKPPHPSECVASLSMPSPTKERGHIDWRRAGSSHALAFVAARNKRGRRRVAVVTQHAPHGRDTMTLAHLFGHSHVRNKVVVVTGASAGVGRATAEAFAREGAFLGLIARDKDAL